MLKAKRLKSMFVLYSACAVMATGFTSQAASEQPEVTTITETKGENTNTHTAVQAISQNIVASAQEMTDVSQQVIADNIAKKEEEERLAKEKAEQEEAEEMLLEAKRREKEELENMTSSSKKSERKAPYRQERRPARRPSPAPQKTETADDDDFDYDKYLSGIDRKQDPNESEIDDILNEYGH